VRPDPARRERRCTTRVRTGGVILSTGPPLLIDVFGGASALHG
jgi:hypothetical protein